MGCGTSFVKYVLFFFNLIVALLGLVILGIGVAALMNWAPILTLLKGHLSVAPWLFIIIGAVTFVIAFFGCCGAIREGHCMVVTYAIFLLVLIIAQVVLAVLLFAYSDSIKGSILNGLKTGFQDRRSETNALAVEAYDALQRQASCCGYNGYSDYPVVPASCCNVVVPYARSESQIQSGSCDATNPAYPGCKEIVANLYDKWNHTIAGVAIGVACVEVVGALFALCLANSIRNMDRRYA